MTLTHVESSSIHHLLILFLSSTDNINYSDVKKYNELDNNVKTISSNKNSNNTPRKTTPLNNSIQPSQLSTGLEVQNQIKVNSIRQFNSIKK